MLAQPTFSPKIPKITCRFVVFATNKQLACSRPLNRPKKLSKHTNRLHCEPMPQTEPVVRLYVNRTRRFVAFKKQQHVMKASKYWYNTLVCAPRYLGVQLQYYIPQAYWYGGTGVLIWWVKVGAFLRIHSTYWYAVYLNSINDRIYTVLNGWLGCQLSWFSL